jgi:VanZ family protein
MLHVPAYGLLALLWIFTLRNHGMAEYPSMYVAFLVALGYGALTELHQAWIPGRVPSAFHVTFNVVGILIFIWLYWWMKLHRSFSLVERVSRNKRP